MIFRGNVFALRKVYLWNVSYAKSRSQSAKLWSLKKNIYILQGINYFVQFNDSNFFFPTGKKNQPKEPLATFNILFWPQVGMEKHAINLQISEH